jgi:hypothetical protein
LQGGFMNKKLLLLTVLFIFIGGSLYALDLSYGVKGGINFAHFGGDDASASGVSDSNSKVGFTGGVFGSIPIEDNVIIQPSILLTLKGQKWESIGNTGFEYDSLFYIEVPVLLKVYPPLKLPGDGKYKANAFIGPYLGIDLFKRYRRTGEVRDVVFAGSPATGDIDDIKTLDVGLVIGIGVDIKKFLFEASYSFGFIALDSSPAALDIKNRVLTLMVGYRIK